MIAASAALMGPLSMAAAADAGDFTYSVSDGKATIIGYTGVGGDIALPSSLGGFPVVAIGERAFYSSVSITTVIIPDGVTSIGISAFSFCPALASVVIGANVTEIGESAFYECTALASMDIPASVSSIEWGAFSYCSSLTMINVDPGNSNYASMDGVLYNKSLTMVLQYPGGKSGAFIIPETVATVGEFSFIDSASLTSVSIPANVTSIEIMAFARCGELTEIVVDPNNPNYASMDGVLYNKDLQILIQYPGGKAGGFVIPDGVTSIGFSFNGCAKLTSLTMPSGISGIQSFSFQLCTSLTSIVIGHDVTSIGAFAFWACTSLSSVVAPDGLTSIGAYAFARDAIPSFTIGKNVTSIGQGAFYGCSAMTEIVVAQDNMNYASLEGVLYNKTLTALIQYPCGKAGPFVIPGNVSMISDNAFYGCALLTAATIPDTVTSIGDESFLECGALASIIVGRGVTSIGQDAFSGCANLTSISFLGLLPPTHVGTDWLAKTNPDLRGHAYDASDFPKPGDNFYGLVMGTVIPAAPGAPINLTASIVGGKAVLAWVAPESGPVTNYTVYRSGSVNDTFLWIASSSGTNYTDAGVASGQTYWYKVSAYNSVGEGPKSAAVSMLVPSTSNNDALIIVALIAIMVLLLLALIAMWNSSKGQR
jgi:hypothetical protein